MELKDKFTEYEKKITDLTNEVISSNRIIGQKDREIEELNRKHAQIEEDFNQRARTIKNTSDDQFHSVKLQHSQELKNQQDENRKLKDAVARLEDRVKSSIHSEQQKDKNLNDIERKHADVGEKLSSVLKQLREEREKSDQVLLEKEDLKRRLAKEEARARRLDEEVKKLEEDEEKAYKLLDEQKKAVALAKQTQAANPEEQETVKETSGNKKDPGAKQDKINQQQTEYLARKNQELKDKLKLLNEKLVKAVGDKVMIINQLRQLGFDLSLLEAPRSAAGTPQQTVATAAGPNAGRPNAWLNQHRPPVTTEPIGRGETQQLHPMNITTSSGLTHDPIHIQDQAGTSLLNNFRVPVPNSQQRPAVLPENLPVPQPQIGGIVPSPMTTAGGFYPQQAPFNPQMNSTGFQNVVANLPLPPGFEQTGPNVPNSGYNTSEGWRTQDPALEIMNKQRVDPTLLGPPHGPSGAPHPDPMMLYAPKFNQDNIAYLSSPGVHHHPFSHLLKNAQSVHQPALLIQRRPLMEDPLSQTLKQGDKYLVHADTYRNGISSLSEEELQEKINSLLKNKQTFFTNS